MCNIYKHSLPFYLILSFLSISETAYAQEGIEQLKTIDASEYKISSISYLYTNTAPLSKMGNFVLGRFLIF